MLSWEQVWPVMRWDRVFVAPTLGNGRHPDNRVLYLRLPAGQQLARFFGAIK